MPTVVIALLAVAWLHDERSAVEQARRSGKDLLIDFSADWCAACKMMERHTWADPLVQREIAEHFVPLRETRLTGYTGPAEMLDWLRSLSGCGRCRREGGR